MASLYVKRLEECRLAPSRRAASTERQPRPAQEWKGPWHHQTDRAHGEKDRTENVWNGSKATGALISAHAK